MNEKLFSGIQPTGDLHIGNYLGAIKNWLKFQNEYESIFCIVDLHAITLPQDPQKLKENILKTTALLIASGIDPEKSQLFIQSQLPQHSELTWILNCQTPMGWLEKMTQFKEKSSKNKERVSVGLFDYPVLMASDILLYHTNVVPVGEDQTQHVELARDIAKRFNSTYGEAFTIPRAVIPDSGARIMNLIDPAKKMAKSDEQPNSIIYLLDSAETVNKKIQSATTDSEKTILFDNNRPGIYNLLTIYKSFTNLTEKDIEAKFKNSGYAEFKKDLASVITEALGPIQQKYNKIITDSSYLNKILTTSANKIKPIADKTLSTVKQKIGLY